MSSLLTSNDHFSSSPMGMLKVGDPFPAFKVQAVVSSDPENAFQTISQDSYPGKWLVISFYPKAWTFVCPTEIKGFAEANAKFEKRDAQILFGSTDNEYAILAWRQHHKDLKNLPFPMLSDIKREISLETGILDENAGVAQRATFIVDPMGIVRFITVTDLKVGRNPAEVLRVLDALQTDELCPCNWQPGEDTL